MDEPSCVSGCASVDYWRSFRPMEPAKMPATASTATVSRYGVRDAPPPGPPPVFGPTITPPRPPVGLGCAAVALGAGVLVGGAGVGVDVGAAVGVRVGVCVFRRPLVVAVASTVGVSKVTCAPPMITAASASLLSRTLDERTSTLRPPRSPSK